MDAELMDFERGDSRCDRRTLRMPWVSVKMVR
jgi:hypothetical protein